MRFSTLLTTGALFTGLVSAGTTQSQDCDVETIYQVEVTEICDCPSATSTTGTPATETPFTTLTCCPTCAPITVTETTQPITSCSSAYVSTTTVCTETGIHKCGDNFYPCWDAPCTIEYSAPCPTCYVCPYSDCWGPDSDNTKVKHVQVYEYVEDNCVGSWDEEWQCNTFPVLITKSKEFSSPTVYIENNITLNVTVAPTTMTYTSTSTTTATQTVTVGPVTGTDAPINRGTSSTPTYPSSSPSATPSGGLLSGPIKFFLDAAQHPGAFASVQDGKLADLDSMNATNFYFKGSELLDANGNMVYISANDLMTGESFIYDQPTLPSDALTDVFALDAENHLMVTVNGTTLVISECPGSVFFQVSYTGNTGTGCVTALLDAQDANAPSPSSSGVSSAPSSIPSMAPSSSPSAVVPPASSTPSASASSTPSAPASSTPSAPASSTPSAPSSSNVPASSSPSSPASSITPSSPASSQPPSSTPSAAVLDVNTSPENRTIEQLGDDDSNSFGQLSAVVLDQNGNPVANAEVDFECTAGASCVFCDAPGGSPITSGTTDANGTFTFYLASYQRGNKTVEVSLAAGGVTPNVSDWTVLPLIDCQASNFIANATRDGSPSPASSLTELIYGADNLTFFAHIVDLNGDPLEGITTTVSIDYPDKKLTRRVQPGGEVVSDDNGNAEFSPTYVTVGSTTYTGQFEGCSDIHYIPVDYSYDPVCNAGSIISPTSGETFSINQPLPIAVQYSAAVGSIAGAEIDVSWNGGSTYLYLDENGAANTTINYIGGTATDQELTFNFANSDPTCSTTVPFTWIRNCDQTQSSLTASDLNPYVYEPVTITITALDADGLAIANEPVTISGSRHSASFTGSTDVNGQATWSPGNPDGNIQGTETFTGAIDSECSYQIILDWYII